MAKVVCVLYDDPVDGYPKSYPRDDLPKIDRYPDGQTLPTPKSIDFKPGALLGSVSGELGLRKYLESNGHTLVVTSDKDGANSVLDRELPDAEIVISQPFWPAYMTAERIAKAPKLKMIVTAGIGSDHTDLEAAINRKLTVAEVTFCNSISVSEHVVMMILGRPGKRPARRLRGRCLVPAAGTERPSLAQHAASRHDAAYLGYVALGAGALRGGYA
jgi:formate dehydrogenase